MVKTMGVNSAFGARITFWGNTGKVIGVLNDFNFRPLTSQIGPLVLILDPE